MKLMRISPSAKPGTTDLWRFIPTSGTRGCVQIGQTVAYFSQHKLTALCFIAKSRVCIYVLEGSRETPRLRKQFWEFMLLLRQGGFNTKGVGVIEVNPHELNVAWRITLMDDALSMTHNGEIYNGLLKEHRQVSGIVATPGDVERR